MKNGERQERVMFEFEGKVAIVTGAGSGIGRASAKKLASAGAKVVVFDRDAKSLGETVDQIVASDGIVASVVGDVSQATDVRRLVEEAVTRFGGLDVAHNNAGIIGPPEVPFVDYPEDGFRHTLDVNVFGVFHCMQAEIRHMLDNGGGAIVNTASVQGLSATRNIAGYVASKHAVLGLTKAAALEYADKNIRINAVCPGFVDTNMTGTYFDEQVRNAIASAHPINRICRPEEIADAVLWLLSERASYAIGAHLVVDGGYLLS